MFCPKCKSEYVEGVRQCADCGVPLVEVLPPERKTKDIDYVEILQTFNWNDIAMIESVLEGSGIDYMVQGETSLTVVQYVEPVRFLVVKEQVAEAKELLKDLELSYRAISGDGRAIAECEDETGEVENGEDKA